jgi:transcription elongation factor GreA
MEYLSKERYNEIKAELDNLINVVYPKVRDDLSEARAQGDLSENCGYRAARRAQAKTISRIRFLQRILEYSRVIDPDQLPKGQVTLLSKVELTNVETNAKMAYSIVSPHEMNLEACKISIKSPIGSALMGRHEGEVVEINVPAGILKLRIDRIS